MKREITPFKIVFGLLAVLATVFLFRGELLRMFFSPTATGVREGAGADATDSFEAVAQGLTVPWEIAFLPGGEMLVTERPGRLLKIGKDRTVIPVAGVEHVGEGGLMGLALHPDFEKNGLLYLCFTTEESTGSMTNRVERYRLEGDAIVEKTVIIEDIPRAVNHDGGRIAFGPDGMLYITTGDAGREELAQDKDSLAGKILRVKADGGIPDDNPFGTAVYSYGHRNSQGLAWDGMGRLWATEHGRSGGSSGLDELNLIEKGKNYGWPVIEGDGLKQGMEGPRVHSGSLDTWAPAGAAFLDGSVFFAGLRGESLYQAKIGLTGEVIDLVAHFRKDFGRLRAVVVGPDGHLYVSTSNTDGRGSARAGDDKIIRIDPAALK